MRNFTPLESTKNRTSVTTRCYRRDVLTGFTLIETIIYIGLFGILMTGIVVSAGPILDGMQRMNEKVAIENEVTVMSRTIVSLIPQIDTSNLVSKPITPSAGNSGSVLSFTTYTGVQYSFRYTNGAIETSVFGSPWIPLTASRVNFTNMSVSHGATQSDVPAYIEIIYEIDGVPYGPYRSYLN